MPSADMSAMILVIRVPFQPRKLLPFSLSFFLFFALPFFTCADPSSGLRSVKEVVDVNWNGPRPLSDSSPFTDTTPGANRRSVNYRNRRLLDGGLERRSKSPADMLSPDQRVERARYASRRILASNMCTSKDISIFQGRDTSSGIPQYVVQISNTCLSDCAPSDIHVFCGWFASALLVNPNTFRRIGYNDCLVNGGKSLRHGDIVRFEYANSFMYSLRFKSAKFC